MGLEASLVEASSVASLRNQENVETIDVLTTDRGRLLTRNLLQTGSKSARHRNLFAARENGIEISLTDLVQPIVVDKAEDIIPRILQSAG